ncbi:MAG: hypothetical protein V3U92_09150 [Cellulophaga sp.]
MSLKTYHILTLLRQLAFIAIVYTLTIQPVIYSFEFQNNTDYELVDIDWEENTNENELEDDDKKVRHHLFFEQYTCSYKLANYQNSNLICRFDQDVLIPPPKKA